MACQAAVGAAERWNALGGKRGLGSDSRKTTIIDRPYSMPSSNRDGFSALQMEVRQIGRELAQELHDKGARRFVRFKVPPSDACDEARTKKGRVAVVFDYSRGPRFIVMGR
jgi:hypothetical protein